MLLVGHLKTDQSFKTRGDNEIYTPTLKIREPSNLGLEVARERSVPAICFRLGPCQRGGWALRSPTHRLFVFSQSPFDKYP